MVDTLANRLSFFIVITLVGMFFAVMSYPRGFMNHCAENKSKRRVIGWSIMAGILLVVPAQYVFFVIFPYVYTVMSAFWGATNILYHDSADRPLIEWIVERQYRGSSTGHRTYRL